MGIPDPLTCLLRNLYAGQNVTVRTRHGTTDWFQGCILSLPLFNLSAEHIMRHSGLDKTQAGIKIARRKESERVGLKLNIQKTKIMGSDSITS